jgi:Transglycosylase SLT domain
MMRTLALAVVLTLAGAPAARAELVFLATGRSVSVREVRQDGESVTLVLRGGGEIVCAATLVVRVTPDEVPVPDPTVAAHRSPDAPSGVFAEPAVVPYADMIDRASATHGVDPGLVRAVIRVESGYRPRARSAKGAMGLMQLMPGTARRYSVKRPYDPASNIDAGTRHLKALLERFPLALAVAAYNAGEAAVERFQGIPPYQETQDYVARVLQTAHFRTEKQ